MECDSGGKSSAPEKFPVGLRVLVVDDDVVCLRVLEQMLSKCMYNVTCCSQATVALELLREKKGSFDIVLSDVHMPDMDGFRLLELVGLEMDLPVIMISADGRTDLVMRGIRHGACDYLIKPIREEELKIIWQHIIRKQWNGSKEPDRSDSIEDNDRQNKAGDDSEYGSSVNEGADGVLKTQKKRRDFKEEDGTDLDNDDPTMAKKPRVVWSVDLHQQFVTAVNQLGIDKAVPKRILELMNVPGLTRENVASHLQKFRLYLKRLSGVAQQQGGLPSSYYGSVEQNPNLASIRRLNIQALAASGQLPPQTLAAIHDEFLSRPAGNLVLPTMDQAPLIHAPPLQGPKCISLDQNVAYGRPLIKCSSNVNTQNSQPIISNEDVQSEFGSWSSKNLPVIVPASSHSNVVETNSNISANFVQQPEHQHERKKQSIMLEPTRSINVRPSCLVIPSLSSPKFQSVSSPASTSQHCIFRNTATEYNPPSVQSIDHGQILSNEFKSGYMFSEFMATGSVSSCSKSAEPNRCKQIQNSPSTLGAVGQLANTVPNLHCIQGSYSGKLDTVFDLGTIRNRMYVGKVSTIPSRFAVEEHDYPLSNLNFYPENAGNKVKQEPNMDFTDNVKVGFRVNHHFSQMI